MEFKLTIDLDTIRSATELAGKLRKVATEVAKLGEVGTRQIRHTNIPGTDGYAIGTWAIEGGEPDSDACTHYKIIRCYRDDRPKRTIKRGLTLAEAQRHCSDPTTRGPGWFDAYTKE